MGNYDVMISIGKKKKNLYVYSGNMIESSKELNMSPISILAEKHA